MRARDVLREKVHASSRGGGVLSTTFSQPLGKNVRDGTLWGYYIDLTVKAERPEWPPSTLGPPADELVVDVVQWGMGCFERYVGSNGERWLAGAVATGEWLVRSQQRGGAMDGGWVHHHPYPHTFPLDPPWLSAIAQGEAASLLFRLGQVTGDERFIEAGRRALLPFDVPPREGGLRVELDGGPFFEEYPTDPPSFVLNGAIFAAWGLYDAALALGDGAGRREFDAFVDTLASNVHRWDTGYWSRYDLFPHPLPNVASRAYHELHVDQLVALDRLAPRDKLRDAVARWRTYQRSALSRRRAFAAKVALRLAVPRNAALARRLPWTPGDR